MVWHPKFYNEQSKALYCYTTSMTRNINHLLELEKKLSSMLALKKKNSFERNSAFTLRNKMKSSALLCFSNSFHCNSGYTASIEQRNSQTRQSCYGTELRIRHEKYDTPGSLGSAPDDSPRSGGI